MAMAGSGKTTVTPGGAESRLVWTDPAVPELEFRAATDADDEFIFKLIGSVMSEYVRLAYGQWNEAEQREAQRQRPSSERKRIIMRDGRSIGMLTTDDKGDHLKIGQLYLLPDCQRQGIGAAILEALKHQARGNGLPLRLNVFHVNPAQSLYLRHGFIPINRSEEKLFMEYRPCAG